MTTPKEIVARLLLKQAEWCERLGSSLYSTLLSHAPVVVFLCDRENFCSAADFGEIGFLGANHAELLFLFQALSDHFLVAWLEDVQGQWRAGKQNNLKREQREQGIQAASGAKRQIRQCR